MDLAHETARNLMKNQIFQVAEAELRWPEAR